MLMYIQNLTFERRHPVLPELNLTWEISEGHNADGRISWPGENFGAPSFYSQRSRDQKAKQLIRGGGARVRRLVLPCCPHPLSQQGSRERCPPPHWVFAHPPQGGRKWVSALFTLRSSPSSPAVGREAFNIITHQSFAMRYHPDNKEDLFVE